MKNKYLKNALKVVMIILILGISIFSGLQFNFPKEWNLNFVINSSTMIRTLLNFAMIVTLFRIPNMFEKYLNSKK